MRLRLTISAISSSAINTPSPSRNAGTTCAPSGEMIAVWHPPRSAFCMAGSGVIEAICASVNQPVAFTTKQPDSSA